MSAFETVRSLFVENLDVAEEDVTPETPLRELVVESLEIANLMLELENAFGIDISDEQMCGFRCVGDIARFAESQ